MRSLHAAVRIALRRYPLPPATTADWDMFYFSVRSMLCMKQTIKVLHAV